jgi:hypothetical protein
MAIPTNNVGSHFGTGPDRKTSGQARHRRVDRLQKTKTAPQGRCFCFCGADETSRWPIGHRDDLLRRDTSVSRRNPAALWQDCVANEFFYESLTLHFLNVCFESKSLSLCVERSHIHKFPRSFPLRGACPTIIVSLASENRVVRGTAIKRTVKITLDDIYGVSHRCSENDKALRCVERASFVGLIRRKAWRTCETRIRDRDNEKCTPKQKGVHLCCGADPAPGASGRGETRTCVLVTKCEEPQKGLSHFAGPTPT